MDMLGLDRIKKQIGKIVHAGIILSSFALVYLFVLSQTALAVCPVCTVAVGAGIGFSRWLGVDDTVTGLWVGGLILSSSFWLFSWLTKKKITFPLRNLFIIVGFYLLVILPLYWSGIIGHLLNTFWGVDKLILGIGFGSVLFLTGVKLDSWLRSTNKGKVYFFYQKVILPVSLLTAGSFIFYFLTK